MIRAAAVLALCAIGCDEPAPPPAAPAVTPDEPPAPELRGRPVELALGATHTCVRLEPGPVVCWGDNSTGALGDGTTERRERLVPVEAVRDATRVVAGGGFTCARRRAGTVACWGDNAHGAVGDGTTARRSSPTDVAGLSGVTELSAGLAAACAILGDRTVRCWGDNREGQLGDEGPATAPVPWPGASDAASVAVGREHTCVLAAGGQVRCRGSNEQGQLASRVGLGDPDSRHQQSQTAIEGAVALSAGDFFTCARLSSGELRCWGDHREGSIGVGRVRTQRFREPTRVGDMTDVEALTTGLASHACVKRRGQGWWCWGRNDEGQIGSGQTHQREPRRLDLVDAPEVVAVGVRHGCAIEAGEVRCFGHNGERQLGASGVGGRRHAVTVRGLPRE